MAGLLRLRALREDHAAAELAAAERRRAEAADRARKTAEMLSGSQLPSGVASTEWLASAASRLSLGALLDEDDALLVVAHDATLARRAEWSRARQDERAVELLAEHHEGRELAEELRTEQREIDEIASGRAAERADATGKEER